MAQHPSNEELKKQALVTLSHAREDIGAEVQRLRQQLNPARALQRVVDRHAGLMMGIAVMAGIIPALLIFRRKRAPQQILSPLMIAAAKPPSKPVLGAILLGILGLVGRSVAPMLLKTIVIPHFLDYMAKRQANPAPSSPRV